MKALRNSSISIAAGMVVIAMCATGAQASSVEPAPDSPLDTVVIDGREYGPEDGVTVEEESFVITPGQGPVGEIFVNPTPPGTIQPMATWGSSYAISTEKAGLRYTGKAKAGANVFNGQRIIQVCFWYSRGGSNVSGEKCSNASSASGSWRAGSEVSHSVWDSLNPIASKTIFNIRTTRINPQAA